MNKYEATLQFSANLSCEIDSSPLTVRSAGRTIIVEVPDMATGLKLFQLGLPRGSRRYRLHQMKSTLDYMATSVEFYVATRWIASLGTETGNRVWKLFGLPTMGFNVRHAVAVYLAEKFSRNA